MSGRVIGAVLLALLSLCAPLTQAAALNADYTFPEPAIEWAPKHYVCYRTQKPIAIDGLLNDEGWEGAPWTDDFVDIEGDHKPRPRFRTRAKMLWDNDYFYIAAEMDEPDVWAKLTERDAVIYHDNDFEMFIDPDGDTHEYYELELNAFGTVWDLLLIKPYRDDGPAVDSWDIQGLMAEVFVHGTLNQPADKDLGWNVEIAIPWLVLEECAHKPAPPEPGDQWRVNFSRVEWRTNVMEGKYRKVFDPETGKKLPEDNWVWSPQGLVAMHYPEMWGFVQFSDVASGRGEVEFEPRAVETAKRALLELYYKQKTLFGRYGRYTADVFELDLTDAPLGGVPWPPAISLTENTYEASLELEGGMTVHISEDGHLWQTR